MKMVAGTMYKFFVEWLDCEELLLCFLLLSSLAMRLPPNNRRFYAQNLFPKRRVHSVY
jgi:hypothetical protein